MEKQLESNQLKPPIEIPLEALSEVLLIGVIDNFIQREGTDYGRVEISYDSKMDQILRQIKAGKVKIVFDPNSESVTLLTQVEWEKLTTEVR